MKASINWLKEFVDFSEDPSKIAALLTIGGLEVENIEKSGDDYILDINVTPNRSDCLSITGIAREIAAITHLPFKDRLASIKKESRAGQPTIKIKDTNLCSRYASRIIYGVKVKPSPEWISKRLELHGFRPTNNIVDITNYLLLEMGHPLHAFDLDKLSGKQIIVKRSGGDYEFQTLDNEKRNLKKNMLLICDAEKPVAIAGVMGGLNTEVDKSTVNILLESAYFDPTSIRKTSKSLNLSTESSYRFEREADINKVVPALNRTAQLIVEIAGGEVTKITDIYPRRFKSPRISVSLKKINDILGINIKSSEVQRVLTAIGIKVSKSKNKTFIVTPPSFRQDIQRDIDVIEEVARLYGYDKIPATLPVSQMQPADKNTLWNFTKKVKQLIVRAGYSEVINYSFLNPSSLDKLKIPEQDHRRNFVKIRNPLRKEDEALRTTLIPSLLDNVRLNISRGENHLRFFEISKVFLNSSNAQRLPNETTKLTVVYAKKGDDSFLWQCSHDGFYDIKGVLEGLFMGLGIKNYSFLQDSSLQEPYLHSGKSCLVKIGRQVIGSLGTMHPKVAQSFDVTPETNIFELDIDRLANLSPSKITYQPLPKYPYVERDIAIIVSEDTMAADVENIIWGIKSDIIESVKIFDIYRGTSIPQGNKSLAFSIRYRAGDRTLTDSEVNKLHSEIIKRLKNSLKAELRI